MKLTPSVDMQIEVYANEHGSVYQCDRTNRLILDFGGVQVSFRVNDFLRLKDRVFGIDLECMACPIRPGAEVKLLIPDNCERCFVLSLRDVLGLRDLLEGALCMLELNSILHERLHRNFI
ncbi:MAG: hypothetical protein AAGI38_18310 [Bacteroidota bacterium]